MEATSTIRCYVTKKSKWYRHDGGVFKSCSFSIKPGRYYSQGDENSPEYSHGNIDLTVYATVSCFFDEFEVGQEVELEIRALNRSTEDDPPKQP
jgi:hypothetical protein